jgi:hypothetical protein
VYALAYGAEYNFAEQAAELAPDHRVAGHSTG